MKKIMLVAASALVLATSMAKQQTEENEDPTYPYMEWSKTAIQQFVEWPGQIGLHDLAKQVKTSVYDEEGKLKVTRLFIIRRDAMTTREFLKNVGCLTYDHDLMFNHSRAFPSVAGGFDSEMDHLLGEALQVKPHEYVLHSKDELPALADKLGSKSSAGLEVEIINVRHTIDACFLNDISKEIQEAVKKAGFVTSYMMAIAGRKSTLSGDIPDPVISLRQLDSVVTLAQVTTTTSGAAKVGTPQTVKNYLFPNTISGILIMLFVVIMLIIGFLLLMAVQTPTYFPTESIDFGKIEK